MNSIQLGGFRERRPGTRSLRTKAILIALAALLLATGAYAWMLHEGRPSFSPDGEIIIFDSTRGGIYTMTAEGRGKALLVGYDDVVAGCPENPVYSPDGEKVAFATRNDTQDRRGDIYICDKDGSNVTRLTYFVPDAGPSGRGVPIAVKKPSFYPDGTKILFTHKEANNSRSWVYTVNVDGTGLKRLSDEEAYDVNPAFSPDGEKILYTSYKSTKPRTDDPDKFEHTDGDIYIMNADGSGKTRLTDGESDYDYPTFSPGGNLITYVGGDVQHEADIYIMNLATREVKRLVDKGAWRFPPLFPPGGGEIAYCAREGLTIEGIASGEKVLIEHIWGEFSFSLDGEKIAFVGGDFEAVVEIINADGTGHIKTAYDYPDEK